MGKKSLTKSKEERRKKKRARKEAMYARFQEYIRKGQNSKSKRFVRKEQKGKSVSLISHPLGKCGNVGCKRCFGINFNPFLEDGKPVNMPRWMYIAWEKAA
jgi:hypothetical protein